MEAEPYDNSGWHIAKLIFTAPLWVSYFSPGCDQNTCREQLVLLTVGRLQCIISGKAWQL